MPSTFSGLFRTLAWADFPQRRGNAPVQGHPATAATTAWAIQRSIVALQPVAGSDPAQFEVVDNLDLTVAFDRRGSFVWSWLFSRSQQFQDDMLNHEQGHYDIAALVCRDFFVDIMLLKSQAFATRNAGTTAAVQVRQQSLDLIPKIQQLYDREVHPEQNSGQSRGPIQQSWDRFIQTAFTEARSTGSQAPDGTPHNTRLVDVLTKNGKSP